MVKQIYLYYNPLLKIYFFNKSNHPYDGHREEIRNGDIENLTELLKSKIDFKRKHSRLIIGNLVPDEVRKRIQQEFKDFGLEFEVLNQS